jgi:hypothetical protein
MPKNIKVDDQKPKNIQVSGETTTYTQTRILTAGVLIPLAGLTYPTTGTVTGVRI